MRHSNVLLGGDEPLTLSVLQEIADWKLEGKSEDNRRYFFHVSEVESIENGSRSYVIGRKGTGKTAISEYLHKRQATKTFAQKLTFKNFPFNELYDLQNAGFSHPNQFITLWKYVIYSCVARMMSRNEATNSKIRPALAQLYPDDPAQALASTIRRWTSTTFALSVLGTGFTLARTPRDTQNTVPWITRVEVLEGLIQQHLDDSTYLIIFDELDEDYNVTVSSRYDQYTALLTSLFKAVQDIRSRFSTRNHRVLPVIFLRDDIYDRLQDPDKTKWIDLKIDLDWSEPKIKNLLAFRIARALGRAEAAVEFSKAWDAVFVQGTISVMPSGKSLPTFDYITRSTYLRPRDYIRYLQLCANEALARSLPRVPFTAVEQVHEAFSHYMRSEIQDELHGILPEIQQLLDVIAQVRKPFFRVAEFDQVYQACLEKKLLGPRRDSESVLRTLFHFSVVGNVTSSQEMFFRYLKKEAQFNPSENVCVHRGLLKALQIVA
jgi:hypothetical protein